MNQQTVRPVRRTGGHPTRRGAVAVYVTISLAGLLGVAALAVDVGMLYSAQAEVQRAADAAALAAAWELLDDGRLKGGAYLDEVLANARDSAVLVAQRNPVLRTGAVVHPLDDVQLGYISDPTDPHCTLTFDDPARTNAATVCVQRDSAHGGPIGLFFGRFFGHDSQGLRVEVTAAFADGTVGYEVTPTSGNAALLPFTLHVQSWSSLLSGSATAGDNYTFDAETGQVLAGADGIAELNLYPGAGSNQLPPGNFGTVDIGSPNNSTQDIARQILEGVSAQDLAYFGGRLELGSDGTVALNGDTGVNAGVKDELEAIKGQPRAILLFSQVSGPGNNAMYTVVGFAGVRVMNVKLTGPMNKKELIIQPAIVVDDAVITGPGPGPSYCVYRPVQLVH